MKILRPQEIHLLRVSGRVTLANGGGKGGSTSSSQSTNTTTNLDYDVSNHDTRSTAADHAVAIGGDGNSLTQNSTSTDNSSTTYASNSGNTYKDIGNTSYSSTTHVTTTDFGSVQASIDAMKATATKALTLSGDVAGDAIGALTHQSDNTMTLISNLFEFAKSSSANSQGTAMQALGLANSATEAATGAKDADKKHMTYALIAGGILLAIIVLKK